MRTIHRPCARAWTLILALCATPLAFAQSGPPTPMKGMDHGEMKGMDHGAVKGMGSGGPPMEMDTGSMQGGPAPAGARDPDAYADGLHMGPMVGMDMADDAKLARVLLDRLELFDGRGTHGQALDAQAWYGSDLNKLWLKVDGDRSGGRLGATRTEALWDRAISTYWSLQAGLRHDFGDGPGRDWAAFGVQGLAPYWFDVQATVYVGANGRTALRFEPEYDLLITQRLILQPNVKVDVFGKNDPRRAIGAGLAEVEAGLRLRYEFTRKFAPYVGVVFSKKVGNTARYARDDGENVTDLKAVAGVRVWF
jgi:copper resistance protein B